MQEQSIDKNEQLSFVNLALALASDYISIYVIDSNDDSYVEYVPEATGRRNRSFPADKSRSPHS